MIEWPERLTSGDIERIEQVAHVDLAMAYNPDLPDIPDAETGEHALMVWEGVLRHPGVLLNVLRAWANVPDDQLADWNDNFDSSAGKQGRIKLEGLLANFFSDLIPSGRGMVFGEFMTKTNQVAEKARERIKAEMAKVTPDSLLDAIEKNSGGSPESPGSASPGPTPGGS